MKCTFKTIVITLIMLFTGIMLFSESTDYDNLFADCFVEVKDGSFSFWIMKTETTQEQYFSITGENPSEFKGNRLPVENVNWFDAIKFCNKLSERQGLSPCYSVNNSTDTSIWADYSDNDVQWNKNADGWRLPTESEWEFAAQENSLYTFSDGDILKDVCWYYPNSNKHTHEVATKKPNSIGLYDMTGNVWEWCWDKYGKHYRVKRGWSWCSSGLAMSAWYNFPNYRDSEHGFRIVRNSQ